jgi:cysteinyl-tRNA synthetase
LTLLPKGLIITGMTEKFSNAVEARKYLDSLLKQIKTVSFNADIRQIWTNVNTMVDELSTIEVRCRQRNNWNAADIYRAEMQENCNLIEKYILMLTLMEPEGD